jgi:hypothetical protein
MEVILEIDMKTLRAKQLLNYIETLPFVKIRKNNAESAWDEAIAEGAVTSQEFHAMLEKEIKNKW